MHLLIPRIKACKAWTISMCLLSMLACSPLVMAQAKSARERGLRTTQTVTGLAQPSSTLMAEHVSVNFGGANASAQANTRQQLADARPMAVSVREYGIGTMTKDEILTAAKAIMSPAKANQIANLIKGVITQGKVGSGVFIYDQQIRPKGSSRDMKLSWSVTVTENGYVFAPDPKVTDPDPTTVYMLYTSLATQSGLPSTWTYADAGTLKWQLRKADGSPASAWTTVNTGGAFDELDTDSEFIINCLANNNTAGCPTGYVDAKKLISDTASVSAVIDYVRKVAPAYDESIDPSTGDTIYQPQMAVSYDQRLLSQSTCLGGQFRNVGRLGYNLKTTVDRFQVTPEGFVQQVNSFSSNSLSPTQSFDITANLTTSIAYASSKIISPFTAEILNISEMPGVQYAAPIVYSSSDHPPVSIVSGIGSISKTAPNQFTIYLQGQQTFSAPAAASNITLNLNPLSVQDIVVNSIKYDWYGAIRANSIEVGFGPSNAYGMNGPIYCSSNNLWWGGCWGSYFGGGGMNQTRAVNASIKPYLVNGNNTVSLMSIREGITTATLTVTTCEAN